jgi:hypothetical protein
MNWPYAFGCVYRHDSLLIATELERRMLHLAAQCLLPQSKAGKECGI